MKDIGITLVIDFCLISLVVLLPNIHFQNFSLKHGQEQLVYNIVSSIHTTGIYTSNCQTVPDLLPESSPVATDTLSSASPPGATDTPLSASIATSEVFGLGPSINVVPPIYIGIRKSL